MVSSNKLKAIILNYNLGKYADELYSKMISDGFSSEQVILVDNGSDKEPPALNTNFKLPYNVRVSGQLNLVLYYLSLYFPQDYYFIVTTSAKLLEEVNYYQAVKNSIHHLGKRKLGFITCSMVGDGLEDYPQINNEMLAHDYSRVSDYQPIATIYSHAVIAACIDNSAGPFNLDLKRGWGMDLELKYIAEKLGMENFVSKELKIEWRKNYLHNMGLADESIICYRSKANEEMFASFNRKYGHNWREIFGIIDKKPLCKRVALSLRTKLKKLYLI